MLVENDTPDVVDALGTHVSIVPYIRWFGLECEHYIAEIYEATQQKLWGTSGLLLLLQYPDAIASILEIFKIQKLVHEARVYYHLPQTDMLRMTTSSTHPIEYHRPDLRK